MPGTIPATSQLDRLISMTAINVLAGSRAMRTDSSYSTSAWAAPSVHSERWMQYPRRRPIVHHSWRLSRPCQRLKRYCQLSIESKIKRVTVSFQKISARTQKFADNGDAHAHVGSGPTRRLTDGPT